MAPEDEPFFQIFKSSTVFQANFKKLGNGHQHQKKKKVSYIAGEILRISWRSLKSLKTYTEKF